MRLTRLAPCLHRLQLGTTNAQLLNAYLWLHDDGVVLIDSGAAGGAGEIEQALTVLDRRLSDVHHLVLTHFHDDHAGSAATVADRSGAVVVAGAADAPIIRGSETGPPPVLSERERPLLATVAAGLPPAPPCGVGTEIVGDQALGVGDLEVLSVPGHTLGSIALFSPADRLLVTGDSIAESGGIVMLGPFNVDPEQAWASVQRLASLDVDIACFGHGDPVLGDAATVLRGAVNPWVG